MSRQLILTVTRRCQLRCSYCPVVRSEGEDLAPEQVRAAVRLFVDRLGGGAVKVFGGEPLLAGPSVEAALDAVAEQPSISRVQLSTNGLLLRDWLPRLGEHPKLAIALSLDGRPADHALHRGRGYRQVVDLLPALRGRRVVLTQTIAPDLAGQAADNFLHLLDLGFRRLNLLPAYLVEWSAEQLGALRGSFERIGAELLDRWASGERLYLRNLTVRAPTPFFNTGLVVDTDGSLHVSNMAVAIDGLRAHTRVGSLDDPPTVQAIDERAARLPELLRAALPGPVWASTQAVDRELSRLCDRLLPAWLESRRGAAP